MVFLMHCVFSCPQIHGLFCRYKEIIVVEEPISFEALEQDQLLCPCPYGVGKSSILESFDHSVLLHELVSKILERIASWVNSKLGVKQQLDMLPINELTWPEVVRRYIRNGLLANESKTWFFEDY
ncbi:hypothetical protein L1987_43852 [Smallanthus sonchifolius]|uniref:Uncharacterized protein n=1 Tax=Smallanthus sonchifolius TaxID=185202 RepID=A0ACB9GMU9_9ASTR|nr:hypothetical protein L1987_43852 [Smallanthus sonchifolius]